MKSKFAANCPWCGRSITVGQDIARHQGRYGHTACVGTIGAMKRTLPQSDGRLPSPSANEPTPPRNLKAFWRVSDKDAP